MEPVGITVNFKPLDRTTLVRNIFGRQYDLAG